MQSPNFAVAALSALSVLVLAGCASTASNTGALPPRPQVAFGKPITEAQLSRWNIDVRSPDGKGLPAGRGSVAQGKQVYDAQCLSCHGPDAKGGPMFGTMVGGIGSFTTNTRVLTPGSMYPYAPLMFDYIRRSMPLTAPQSLSADENYAVSAYILHLNGLVPADAVMDAQSMIALQMPNRNGFILDDRPDVKAVRCMTNCK